MTDRPGEATFAFVKLVVHDLRKQATFYQAVCGYEEAELLTAYIGDKPIEEIILRRTGGALDLVLLTYPNEPPPSQSNGITAFYTEDLDAYELRLLNAGGTVVHPIHSVDVRANRMRIGFFADPEGNLLEVMER